MAKFYVACLASYNNGVLHGKWVDASSDVDEMQAEIDKILLSSPFPNVTVPSYEAAARAAGWTRNDHNGMFVAPVGSETRMADYSDWEELCEENEIEPLQVPSAEEWAMHDYEDLPKMFGEYPQLKDIAKYVELIEDNPDWDEQDILAVVNEYNDLNYASDRISDNFVGRYSTFRDYADEFADEVVMCDTKNQTLINYFDYEAFARDLQMDYTVIDVSDGVLIFYA